MESLKVPYLELTALSEPHEPESIEQVFSSRVPQLTCIWMSLPGASGLGKLTTETMKNQRGTLKNHKKTFWNQKKLSGTLTNHKKHSGTVKKQPGTMKN